MDGNKCSEKQWTTIFNQTILMSLDTAMTIIYTVSIVMYTHVGRMNVKKTIDSHTWNRYHHQLYLRTFMLRLLPEDLPRHLHTNST